MSWPATLAPSRICNCSEAFAIASESKTEFDKSPSEAGERSATRISQPPPPPTASRPGLAKTTTGGNPVEATTIHASIGDIIDNKYRVDEVIGQGGMGQVLGATHLELQQKVALKFMSPAIMEIPGAVARFTREARAVAKLRSKHVCRVLDIGETAEGAKYIVIEYLEGSDLSKLLAIHEKLPVAQAIEYISQACDALGEAHALDIVHRDIKPANLFLDSGREGQSVLKVLDFGISKNLGDDTDLIVTATNALMGSPIYMSPEQLLAPKTVDTRADIWSLGIVLHELVTGHPPFRAATLPEVIALIVNDRRPPSSMVSEEIAEPLRLIIARCLDRDPVRRYRTTELLAEALAAIAPAIAGGAHSEIATAVQAGEDTPHALPWKWILVAAATLALAGVLFFAISASSSSESPSPAAQETSREQTQRKESKPGSSTMVRPKVVLPSAEERREGGSATDAARDAGSAEIKTSQPIIEPATRVETAPKRPSKEHVGRAARAGKVHRTGKGPKAGKGLMDPTEGSGKGRDPGDDDVMDPEL